MNKHYYTWSDVEGAVLELARQIQMDGWRPDYIVGLTRGGLMPANLLSQYTGIKMHTLNVSLRDGGETESNLWMSEDAFGYIAKENATDGTRSDPLSRAKILIVDDINDQGSTLNWIKQDWQSSCLPNDPAWNDIWNKNVRFAVLTNNASSSFKDIDYSVWEVNKAEKDCWLVYPWEDFWL